MGEMNTRGFTYNLNGALKKSLMAMTDRHLVLFSGRFGVDKSPLQWGVKVTGNHF
jgi:hypothetical protein